MHNFLTVTQCLYKCLTVYGKCRREDVAEAVEEDNELQTIGRLQALLAMSREENNQLQE